MNKLKSIIIALSLTIFPIMSQAIDSTYIHPPAHISPNRIITLNVLYYKTGLVDYKLGSTSLPTVRCNNNGTLNWQRFYYKNTGTFISGESDSGYFYYSCTENYFTNDPDYIKLVNNNWVDCTNAGYRCSIKHARPPVIEITAVLPNSTTTFEGSHAKIAFNDMSLFLDYNHAIGLQKIGTRAHTFDQSNTLTVTWNFDLRGEFPPMTYASSFGLSLRGDTPGIPAPSAVQGSNAGTYMCPEVGSAILYLNPTMLGKSCTLRCNGEWKWLAKGNARCSHTSVSGCFLSNRPEITCV